MCPVGYGMNQGSKSNVLFIYYNNLCSGIDGILFFFTVTNVCVYVFIFSCINCLLPEIKNDDRSRRSID